MPLNLEFPLFNNEKPRYFLEKPHRKIVGEITYFVENEEIKQNFLGNDTLKFQYKQNYFNDMTATIEESPHFKELKGNYLIRRVTSTTEQYFVITNNPKSLDENSSHVEVDCVELQQIINNKTLRSFKDVVPLYDPALNTGFLNKTLEAMTPWRVDYVAPSLTSPEYKMREFDISEQKLLEAIMEAISAYGEYVPIFNTVDMTVSIYDIDTYGRDTGIRLFEGAFLKSVLENPNFNKVITRLYLYGKDNDSIYNLTPTGMPYIEKLDYYMRGFEQDTNGNVISSSKYMSDELCKAEIAYQELLVQSGGIFDGYLSHKSDLEAEKNDLQDEYAVLHTQWMVLQNQKQTLIAANQNQSGINAQIATQESLMEAKQGQIDHKQIEIDIVNNDIEQLGLQVRIESNFTPELLKERDFYIKEGTFRNQHYINMEDLLFEGWQQLETLGEPQFTFEVDMVDIEQQMNQPDLHGKMRVGDYLHLDIDAYNISSRLRILSISRTEDSCTIEVSNSPLTGTSKGLLSDFLKKGYATSSQVDFKSHVWNLSEANSTDIHRLRTEAWDANKQAVEAGSNQNYTLNEFGFTLKSPDDPDNFLRILHNVIAFTNNGGLTYETAITPEGMIADRLVGNLVVGDRLVIQNTSGTFEVTGDSVSITDLDLRMETSNKKNLVLINGTDGFKIQKNIGTTANPVWDDQIVLNTEGDAQFKGAIVMGSGNNIVTLNEQGLFAGHSQFANAPFRVDMLGNLTANKLTANSADIKDSTFEGGAIVGSSININNAFMVSPVGFMHLTTGRLEGDLVVVGNINGGNINGANFNGGTITVSQTINAGGGLFFDGGSPFIADNYNSSITFVPTGAPNRTISIQTDYLRWNNQIVATRDWVMIQIANILGG